MKGFLDSRKVLLDWVSQRKDFESSNENQARKGERLGKP